MMNIPTDEELRAAWMRDLEARQRERQGADLGRRILFSVVLVFIFIWICVTFAPR